jgi:LEA14-like dessication related protein
MKLQKKHYIAGAIGLVTFTGAMAYLQYKRMMDYVVKVRKVDPKKVSAKLISLDMVIDYTNKGNVDIQVENTIANVFINDKPVTKIELKKSFVIKGSSTFPVSLNVQFNPSDVLNALKINLVDVAINPQKINIRVDLVLKAKLWFFNINIKDKYVFNLKDLLTKKE